MKALDTNVLARFFIDDADDPQAHLQQPAAVAALSERSYVSVTVLLELEWVMRGFYALPARVIAQVLRALASIPHVTIESADEAEEQVRRGGLDAYAAGRPSACLLARTLWSTVNVS